MISTFRNVNDALDIDAVGKSNDLFAAAGLTSLLATAQLAEEYSRRSRTSRDLPHRTANGRTCTRLSEKKLPTSPRLRLLERYRLWNDATTAADTPTSKAFTV